MADLDILVVSYLFSLSHGEEAVEWQFLILTVFLNVDLSLLNVLLAFDQFHISDITILILDPA